MTDQWKLTRIAAEIKNYYNDTPQGADCIDNGFASYRNFINYLEDRGWPQVPQTTEKILRTARKFGYISSKKIGNRVIFLPIGMKEAQNASIIQ